MLTIGSLLCLVVAGVVVAQGHLLTEDVLLLVGGIADGLDGDLARQTGRMTSLGGFLDSICDHCGDYAFCLGLIWFYLSARHDRDHPRRLVGQLGAPYIDRIANGLLQIHAEVIICSPALPSEDSRSRVRSATGSRLGHPSS